MQGQSAKVIGETMGNALGEVSVAIGLIVLALKHQPGFDAEDFNSRIQSAIDELSAREEDKRPIAVGILESTL